jgi:phenylacetate-CoA ligase
VCARSLAAAGAVPGDVFQNAYGYGLFTGGLGMHYGGERMGLTVIPVSAGNTERQILLLQDLRPRIFACTPSYALALAEALAERGIDATGLGLATLILGAEPWTEEMRGRIEAAFAAHAVNIYGLSEVIGPGVSCECVEVKHGSHVFEDHFLPEIVDPETGEPKAPGEIGELVLTSLTKEALPIVRYRTGDLCSLDLEPCACGRTLARMSRIVGRADDMLIIRGVNLFPTQVEAVLVEFADLSPHYRLLVRREGELDAIAIEVEVTAELHGRAAESGLEPLRRDIGRRLAGVTMLTNVDIRFVAPGTLPRSEGGKLRRVVDERKPS